MKISLINNTMNPNPKKEFNWWILRYCFYCKKVTKFLYCDDCHHYYCTNHAYYESEGWEYSYKSYPVHDNCLK
jgi:hypothetical protein